MDAERLDLDETFDVVVLSHTIGYLDDVLQAKELPYIAELVAHAIADEPPVLLREGGLIRAGYDAELERLRQVERDGRDWLADLEARERERTGIKNLRVRYML